MFQITLLETNLPIILNGALVTIALSTAAFLIGAVIGAIACAMARQKLKSLQLLSAGYVDFFRTVPELVPVIWLYACSPFILNIDLSPGTVGLIAFSLISGASFAEIIRTGLDAIPKGQRDAGRALGLRESAVLVKIVIPQAIGVMLPPSLNLYSDIVKSSSILSLIGVVELTYQTATLSAATYRYLEFYTLAGIIYILMISSISIASTFIGNRYSRFLKT